MFEGSCRVKGPGVCSELADWGQGLGRGRAGTEVGGTQQGLGSLEDLARSGVTSLKRQQVQSSHSGAGLLLCLSPTAPCVPRCPQTLGQQDAGGTMPHTVA